MKRKQFLKGSAIFGLTASVPNLLKAQSGLFETGTGRRVYRILNADKSLVGTLPVLRVFAGDHDDYVSPYVFFDEFGPVTVKANDKPLRVNAHPHAGIVPTTYFLAGSGHHRDSLNYDFQIGKGDFMMFTSGKGAIHMEETGKKLYDEGGLYHGFQIWLNLPSKYKFINPSTDVHRIDKMGSIQADTYSATVVLGELFGSKSKIELLSPAFYYHIRMKAGCKLDIPVDPAHNIWAYVVNGEVETEGRKVIRRNQVALYERGDDRLNLFSSGEAELLVAGGKPLHEPVYSYGPFVMNTEEEILRCINDYKSGKMGSPEAVDGFGGR
jgi:hypothetical protein